MWKTIDSFLLLVLSSIISGSELELDPNGYILYCPCMGRFGNQADHFLGALSFAQGLDRTLVLPPWVEYRPGNPKSVQIPFKTYFKIEPLAEYHRVLPMEDFMEKLAPKIWPVGKRKVYCYAARGGSDSCNAKEGNPFGPFWDTFNIDFDDSEFTGPLNYDSQGNAAKWNDQFPSETHYVMAFTGAPASFPVREPDVQLQKYLQWSDQIDTAAKTFINKNFGDQPFIGLHLRNGKDWENACKHIQPSSKQNMFASAQCLGYRLEHGQIDKEICLPSKETVLKQIKQMVKKTKVKNIFVAADSDPMINEIQKMLKKKINKVVTSTETSPHLDLAILGKADFHIGNCVSTFSAFAARERRVNGKPVSFWAFEPRKHEEL